MSGSHGHSLHFHADSPVHALAPEIKLVALLLFVVSVVATSTSQWWWFALHATLLVTAVRLSRVPIGHLARRAWVEIPFIVFALVMPFVASGPRTQVLGVEVSEPGLHAAIALLIRGTLGVLASLLFAATTQAPDLVSGLDRLRLPRQLVQILGFTVRYLDVVTGQLRSMRMAREARGFQASSVRHWPVLASTAAALFIRSYERGERVHLAMLARGYGGRMPRSESAPVPPATWARALTIPATATVIAIVSHLS